MHPVSTVTAINLSTFLSTNIKQLEGTQMTGSREEDEEVEDDEKSSEFLVVKAMGINNRLISLITDSCPQHQQQQQQQQLQQEHQADLSTLPAPSRPLCMLVTSHFVYLCWISLVCCWHEFSAGCSPAFAVLTMFCMLCS